ncbi:MAG: hypothetical protein M1522_00970 [Actinobacteria bacterium]|nr:hypothetical protein [Actinomycetota bacterium]MDA8185800.1 hypothetical protein [Actinomycetota bacterium]
MGELAPEEEWLRSLWGQFDPMPAAVAEAARRAIASRIQAAVVLPIVADSWDDERGAFEGQPPTPDRLATRTVRFGGLEGGIRIDLVITPGSTCRTAGGADQAAQSLHVAGKVAPPLESRVWLEHGGAVNEGEITSLGDFSWIDVRQGPMRIVCWPRAAYAPRAGPASPRTAAGAGGGVRPIATEWIMV